MKKSKIPLCKCSNYLLEFDDKTFYIKLFLTICFTFISLTSSCSSVNDMYNHLMPIKAKPDILLNPTCEIESLVSLKDRSHIIIYNGINPSIEVWLNSSSTYLKFAKDYQNLNALKPYGSTACRYANVEKIFFFIEIHSNISWTTFFVEILIPLFLLYITIAKLYLPFQLTWAVFFFSLFSITILSNILRIVYPKCLVWDIQSYVSSEQTIEAVI